MISVDVHSPYSPFFRDMLGLNQNLEDNVIPLPEPSSDICSLLKILTGTAGTVDNFQADIKSSLRLFSLASKYEIVGGNHKWISALLERFIKDNPLECFAAACEHIPTEKRIAKLSIRLFPSSAVVALPDPDAHRYGRAHSDYLCNHLNFADQINPARWGKTYIQRLGLLNYSAYVYAWSGCYLTRRTTAADGPRILIDLADTFCAKLEQK
jgi:hypothetical protein